MQICDNRDCTGCFACMNVCPKDAIIVTVDALGKSIPLIDKEKCVECGLCKKICPANKVLEMKRADFSYAVWSVDDTDIRLSSSGGAATVFARNIIQNGGSVFGAACLDGETKHICVKTEDELEKLRGSKYVQSEVGYIYRHVKKELDCLKKVLFIGTPCQIAGLKAYLHSEYNNLITVDLICHGTPPQQYIKEHLGYVLSGGEFERYSFRGEYDYFLSVYNKEDEIIYQKDIENDNYYAAFYDALIFRDNCYNCKYACPRRCSDITIGDFWGLDRSTLVNQYEGRISLVLPNTIKGNAFFEDCKNDFVYEKRTLEEALNPVQENLLHPSRPHPDRMYFVTNYSKHGLEKTVDYIVTKQRMKRKIKKLVKKVLPNKLVKCIGKSIKVI